MRRDGREPEPSGPNDAVLGLKTAVTHCLRRAAAAAAAAESCDTSIRQDM